MRFDERTHTYYTDDGLEIPSVTQILKEIGVIDTTYYTEAGAAKGKNFHKCLELLDTDYLDWSTVPEQWLNSVRAWSEWIGECKIEHCEEPMYDPELFYAGTPDRVIDVPGVGRMVVDIKSGAKAPWHLLQCAMYANMVPDRVDELVVWYKRDTKKGYDVVRGRPSLGIAKSVMEVYAWVKK